MIPGTVVLLGSPLLAPGSWGELPKALRAADPSIDVLAPSVADDEKPPFGQRYLTGVVLAVRSAQARAPLALIAHAAAGPLLPGVGRALRDAGHHVGGYVFFDADLAAPGRPSRLDLLRRETDGRAVVLEAVLETGAGYPDRAPRGVAVRPRGRAFYEEPLPTSDDWPDAPCGYLRTLARRAAQARRARARGWPVVEVGVDEQEAVVETDDDAKRRLLWLDDPQGVAFALLEVIDRL